MLYYVGTATVFDTPENPRVSMKVYRVSDVTRLGRVVVWEGTRSLKPVRAGQPHLWLLEALDQLLDR